MLIFDDSGQTDFLTTAFQVNELIFDGAQAVVEPPSLILLAGGLFVLAAATWRQRGQNA